MFKLSRLILLLAPAFLVVATAYAQVETVAVKTEMRALPGRLDSVKVLNSNSPEVIQTEGILVSTFPPQGKGEPDAHLNYSFTGKFDLFAHHIAKQEPEDTRTLYLAVIAQSASNEPVQLRFLEGASYLSQPDAPFIQLNAVEDNGSGQIYSGPGDRVTDDVLRHKLSPEFPQSVTLQPEKPQVLTVLPIPVSGLTPPLNGRSMLLKLQADGPVYVATVATFSPYAMGRTVSRPSDAKLLDLLQCGRLSGPREKSPTFPGKEGHVVYGRVAGVQEGATWTARITGAADASGALKVPAIGSSVSFPISSVVNGAFGTGQVQSATLLKREPETAYAAHGNYGVKYDITIPLLNDSTADALVLVKLQTPLKAAGKSSEIYFNKILSPQVFFRGTVSASFIDSQRVPHKKYTHLVQHRGQAGVPLIAQYLMPKEERTVRLEFIYPPDSTPPQVLTIESADPAAAGD